MSQADIQAMFLTMFGGEHAKEIALAKYVQFDEAASWIAFGTYSWPAVGPTSIVQMLIAGDFLQWQETQRREMEIKFEFARDQLFAAAGNGTTMLIGKPPAKDLEQDITNDPKIPRAQFFEIVPGEPLKNGDWSEYPDGYRIGERDYVALFVQSQDLNRLFGAFHLDAAASPNSDSTYGAAEDAPEMPHKQRGRRPKWQWEQILAAVGFQIGQQGRIPESQADLERMIAQYCQDEFGDEPSSGMTREKASPMFDRLRRNS